MSRYSNFLSDESGAVTVDWVVLTASVVVLVLTMIASLGSMNEDLADLISTAISTGDDAGLGNYKN